MCKYSIKAERKKSCPNGQMLVLLSVPIIPFTDHLAQHSSNTKHHQAQTTKANPERASPQVVKVF